MLSEPEPPLVFCSYTTADRDRVVPFVDYLGSRGIQVWIDFRRLLAGQTWDREIRRALDKASIILAFLSNKSVEKRGYVQRELKIALDKFQEKVLGDIYLIPILLDPDTGIPEQVGSVQCVRGWEGDPFAEIEKSIRHQLERIGAQVQQTQEKSKIHWTRPRYKEVWDGLPGYEVDAGFLQLNSTEYQHIEDINHVVRGWMADRIMDTRRVKFEQNAEWYNFGQERLSRCTTLDIHCADPTIVGKVASVQCSMHTYSPGAAHGQTAIVSWAFLIDPVIRIESIKDIFVEEEQAFPVIQKRVREVLLAPDPSGERQLFEDTVEAGTAKWEHFETFVFKEEGVEFIFDPYQVAPYADGVQFAIVEYQLIAEMMAPHLAAALSVGHMVMGDPRWLWKKKAKAD